MTAHTPGPWRVVDTGAHEIRINHTRPHALGAISLTVAKAVARPTWREEAEANARLIAAAPELLWALQSLLIAQGDKEEFAAVLQSNDAIAKALGVIV